MSRCKCCGYEQITTHGGGCTGGGGSGEVIFTDIPPVIAVQPPTDDSAKRKTMPVATGCFDYFPDALWAIAELSYWGNEKHNPGEPLHDARAKSADDADCLLRHFKDRGKWDEIKLKDGRTVKVKHSTAMAWRALRLLQRELEAEGAPIARGAKP